MLEPIGRGVLDHPLARVMTAEGVTSFFQDKSQRSRGATGVRVLLDFTLRIEEGAGKAGRWPRPWPASNKKAGGSHHRFGRGDPALPAQWLYDLYVISPGPGLSCPRHRRNHLSPT